MNLAHKTVFGAILFSSVFTVSTEANAAKKDKYDLSGYIMLDHDSFDGAFLEDSNESQSLTGVRRALLSFKTKIDDNWQAKLKFGFADEETELKDAYIRYKGWNWADITIGKQKETFGLEQVTCSCNSIMIERSLVTNALSPGRAIGVNLSGDLATVNWQLGAYQPENEDASTAVTGRLVWLALQSDENLLHLGTAFSGRTLSITEKDEDEGYNFRINESMEVYYSDSLIEGKKLFAENISQYGIEFLWQFHGFTSSAEWQQSRVIDVDNDEYVYQGGYLQLSYLFSGQNRRYKNSKMGKVTTKGWEITSRYSEFELVEEVVQAKILSVGINYNVNKKLKFMTNLINATHYKNNTEYDAGNALSLRAQYTF